MERSLIAASVFVAAIAGVPHRLDAQHDTVNAPQQMAKLGEGGPVSTVAQPRLRKATGNFRLSYSPRDEALGWWRGGLAYLHVELWAQGDVIAFECNGTGVYVLEPDATDPKLLVGGDSVCKAFGAQARASLDVTHGGLLYATGPSDAGVWRLDMRTGRRERLTPPGLEWTVGEPVASPDGRRVAFVWDKGEASGGDQLYLMNADGSAPKPIGPALHGDEFAELTWAPDGRLAFSYRPEGAESGVLNVMVAVADTVGAMAKTVAGGMSPSWSPDGRWLAFVKPVVPNRGYARTAAVAIVRANGTGERVVFANSDTGAFTNGFEWIRNGTPEGRIVWDPGSTFVVFSRSDSGGMSLWRVNVDGTRLRQLTTRARPQSNW